MDRLTLNVLVERREDVWARLATQGKGEEMWLRLRMTIMNVRFYIIGVAGEMRAKYRAADKVPPSRGGWVLMS